jgi:hypothetical protein
VIVLDFKTAILAADAALQAGKLQAQVDPHAGECRYRNDDGAPCYVGAMISDDQWETNIASKEDDDQDRNVRSVSRLIDNKVLSIRVGGLRGGRARAKLVLSYLQDIHDDAVGDTDAVNKQKLAELEEASAFVVAAVMVGRIPTFDRNGNLK